MINAPTDLLKAARVAEQAAYAAGTHLQASRSRLSEVVITHKAPGDVVNAIEHEARSLIRGVVLRQFPGHRFVGEPGSDDAGVLADGRPVWTVDALDEAVNYLRGYPQYAVTIALVERGEPQVGVVYDPSRNEFFGAIRGHGAVLNGAPIRCAKPRATAESLAATVFPKPASAHMPVYMAELGRVLRAFSGVRRSGSMALELAYLAAGRIDAFWAHDIGAWECAAGVVLSREAGALIHARDGLPVLASHTVLACTAGLFEPLLSLLAEP